FAEQEMPSPQNPADIRLPGKDTKGSRIGNDNEVGRPRHFVEVHSAASREGREGPRAGWLERRGRDVYVVAILQGIQERRKRDCFRARGAVRVGPGNAKQFQFFL